MRSCNACFWGRFVPADEDGECMNRPPHVFLVHDAQGSATFVSMRPAIRRDDYCFFFQFKTGPKPQPPQPETPI